MQITDTLTCTIEKIVYGGKGLARVDGRVIFVPGTAPGEKVLVSIKEIKRSYAIAEIIEIIEPSADRIDPNCRITGALRESIRIPGCVFDHISYEAEVAIKQKQLTEFIDHLPGVVAENSVPLKKSPDDTEVVPPVLFMQDFEESGGSGSVPTALSRLFQQNRNSTSDAKKANIPTDTPNKCQNSNCVPFEILPPFSSRKQLHYRNKLILHTHSRRGAVRLGYQEERSHRVLDISECPLSCEPINEKLHAIRSSAQFRNLPDRSTVTIRYTKADGILWWINRPSTKSWITEESAIGPLRVSSDGFYQTNPAVSDALTRTAAAWFKEQPTENILDLYCGVGLFGLACMKEGGRALTGLESGKRAILAARHNAAKLDIPANFQVRELGRKELHLKQYTKDTSKTTCIVDPPRAGMDKGVTQTLAQSGIPRIIYISCNPSTLQRDLKILITEGGYRIRRVQLFDMFPRTAHFETIVEITERAP